MSVRDRQATVMLFPASKAATNSSRSGLFVAFDILCSHPCVQEGVEGRNAVCVHVRDGYITIKNLPSLAFNMPGPFTFVEHRAHNVNLFVLYKSCVPLHLTCCGRPPHAKGSK